VTEAAGGILVVCTGNVCRSPLAQLLLRARLGPLLPELAVSSVGTAALVGEPMTAQGQLVARRLGVDPAAHLARQLDPAELSSAALVLTMTREHRRAVVSASPGCVRRAFTLPEFARLLERVAVAWSPGSETEPRFADIVEAAASTRGSVRPAAPDDDDIVDPFGRSDAVYDRSARQIERAVAAIADALSRITGRSAA
jgi:protein-tyrosine phosphatase